MCYDIISVGALTLVDSVASASHVLVNCMVGYPFDLDNAAPDCFNTNLYPVPGKGKYPRAGVFSVKATAMAGSDVSSDCPDLRMTEFDGADRNESHSSPGFSVACVCPYELIVVWSALRLEYSPFRLWVWVMELVQ